MALLDFTDRGIYCKQGDFYIDPWKPVSRAVITHGHSDHARPGHQHYLCTVAAQPVIRYRLGPVAIQTLPYAKPLTVNGVRVSFHPAGHVPGSAQVRVEYQGEVWVVSGDYKLEPDGLSEPFETVPCHSFISECTFGLPVFNWQPQQEIMTDVNAWWRENQAAGKATLLTAYALGKAQRILKNIDSGIGTIFTHGAIENINDVLRNQGIHIPDTRRLTPDTPKKQLQGNLIIAPPSVLGSAWMRRLPDVSTGVASGWMALRGTRRRYAVDRGFILSDHADWPALNQAVRETGAQNIYATHGYTTLFSRWLNSQGYTASEVKTGYEGDEAGILKGE